VALLKYPTSNLEKIAEYTKNLTEIEDKATAYVCKNFNCNLPTTDIGKFLELVNK
jgi:hypothetical protein